MYDFRGQLLGQGGKFWDSDIQSTFENGFWFKTI